MIEVPNGVLYVTGSFIQPCEVVMAVAVVGLALERMVIRRDRRVAAALVLQQHAQIEEESGAGFACRDSIAVQPLGRLPVARQMQQPPAIDVCLNMLCVGRDDLLIELLRRYRVRVFEREGLREPGARYRRAARA